MSGPHMMLTPYLNIFYRSLSAMHPSKPSILMLLLAFNWAILECILCYADSLMAQVFKKTTLAYSAVFVSSGSKSSFLLDKIDLTISESLTFI